MICRAVTRDRVEPRELNRGRHRADARRVATEGFRPSGSSRSAGSAKQDGWSLRGARAGQSQSATLISVSTSGMGRRYVQSTLPAQTASR
jgi:hypothetical protein